jgi:hypothetical protein
LIETKILFVADTTNNKANFLAPFSPPLVRFQQKNIDGGGGYDNKKM